MAAQQEGLYILLISVHGLIRGHDLELGRDADTGGQTRYVVELAQALSQCKQIDRVDLLTRRVVDPQVGAEYSRSDEQTSRKVHIVRLDAGPEEYILKEQLWDFLDSFSDRTLDYLRDLGRTPHIVHSHYADAGYVGTRIANMLGVPLVHTGHSLGRVKRRRLLARGLKRDDIEQRYNMSRRINAEEDTLGAAELVITSTHQEIEAQYELYDYYQPQNMRVIPPGTDLGSFYPPDGSERESLIYRQIARFLQQPDKPMILALSRPDTRKNIPTLVNAYGESKALQDAANLVIIAGNRDDIQDMEEDSQEVLTDILLKIDQHDLYGKVAYPKHHLPDDVPVIYRLAAASKGVFINPALTEPFGLTLIEAAASGLPITATEDGGPIDIINNCHNGYLIDSLDKAQIADTLLKILGDSTLWHALSNNGIGSVSRHYSWTAHAETYLTAIRPLIERVEPVERRLPPRRSRLYHDRTIITDMDQSLLGDPQSLADFVSVIKNNRKCATFAIATGRRLDDALRTLKRFGIPQPDLLLTSLGTEIHYAPRLSIDAGWSRHIDYLWNPRAVRRVLAELPGLKRQPNSEQSRFKISYYIDPDKAPEIGEINSLLRQNDQTVNVFYSFGQFLDIVPVRASKGFALRWFTDQWDISLKNVLAAGGSGADEDMMRGNTQAVVVANRHHEELSELTDVEHIYYAKQPYAAGILEAIKHYKFLDTCGVPPQ
ncbi:MAG TPA: glycosyltransferase [Gammaproteobacteria bacterium]|nr:glycosyltransferase [Gammaproteobacteria bacterium]